jgi:hypothetical protein
MADKKMMFKFGDGLREINVGDKVYVVGNDRRNGPPREMYIRRIGRKFMELGYDMNPSRNCDEWYLETGRLKSQYLGGTVYSSQETYERVIKEREVILAVQSRCGGSYTPVLTYAQALKIRTILEE